MTAHRHPTRAPHLGSSSRGGHRPRHERGYALLSILLAVGVAAAFASVYGRHVVVDGRANLSSDQLQEAREACHSSLAVMRQSLVAGSTPPSGAATGLDAVVGVQQGGSGHQILEAVAVSPDGFGARRVAEMALDPAADSAPSGSGKLPTLSSATVSDLLTDGNLQRTDYHGSVSITGETLEGLLVVHDGAMLVLSDVIVNGTIVSADSLDVDGNLGRFNSGTAPAVLLDGNVRLEAGDELPGSAIVMPDGIVLTTGTDARLQIHGDVVAHVAILGQPGALGGNVSAVAPYLHPGLDRLGAERKPGSWSDGLDLGGSQEPRFVAFPTPSSSLSELGPILDYWSTH